ncbi:prepilin-type N-terminal cleavage/methylation domain-containing protein [Celerinatantimonas sp. YJH-8]|uniref:pilin n=1 Tax=Celerinatantimonas sp. YJH-8 TaxID=3228714 RepID=UPI0038C8B00B
MMSVTSSVNTRGFTLIELLITLAIVATLAAMAMPVYSHYINRAKFSELIQATGPIKTALDVCTQSHARSELTQDEQDPCLNSAAPFILDETTTSQNPQTEIRSLEVQPLAAGAQTSSAGSIGYSIIVTAKSDLNNNDDNMPLTYQLDGSLDPDQNTLRWTTSGSCLTQGWC